MRRFALILLSLCLLLAFVSAEEAVTELNWTDVQEAASGMEGVFAQLGGTDLMMFVPAGYVDREPESDHFLNLVDEQAGCVISGQILPIGTAVFKGGLKATGVAETDDCVLNGLTAVRYHMTLDGVAAEGIAIETVDGQTINISFAPVSEAYAETAEIMLRSIQPLK